MSVFKFVLKRLLASANIEVRRIVSAETATAALSSADPVTFQYYSDLRPAPMLTVDLADVRAGVMGFRYSSPDLHPLVHASSLARREPSAATMATAIRSAMARYYEMAQPASALEVVGLPGEEAPGLVSVPAYKWVFPWTERSIEENAKFRWICLQEEGLINSARVSAADGVTLFGPVSERKLAIETARLTNLVTSVQASGFRVDARKPLEVFGLRADGEYRWFVVQGQHRFAVCAAFDLEHTTARVTRIIRREDAAYWPHVVAKTFTEEGARKLFDRIHAGEAPLCAHSWLAQATQSREPVSSARGVPLACPAESIPS
jgi:hypothetical protein